MPRVDGGGASCLAWRGVALRAAAEVLHHEEARQRRRGVFEGWRRGRACLAAGRFSSLVSSSHPLISGRGVRSLKGGAYTSLKKEKKKYAVRDRLAAAQRPSAILPPAPLLWVPSLVPGRCAACLTTSFPCFATCNCACLGARHYRVGRCHCGVYRQGAARRFTQGLVSLEERQEAQYSWGGTQSTSAQATKEMPQH